MSFDHCLKNQFQNVNNLYFFFAKLFYLAKTFLRHTRPIFEFQASSSVRRIHKPIVESRAYVARSLFLYNRTLEVFQGAAELKSGTDYSWNIFNRYSHYGKIVLIRIKITANTFAVQHVRAIDLFSFHLGCCLPYAFGTKWRDKLFLIKINSRGRWKIRTYVQYF